MGLQDLADSHLCVPSDEGANAGSKVACLVAGMAAGADSIDDMVLRHGGMGRVFNGVYAPSTLGSFLRAFAFGHIRQLDAVASRLLVGLAQKTPLMAGIEEYALLVYIDDTDEREAAARPLRRAGQAHRDLHQDVLHRPLQPQLNQAAPAAPRQSEAGPNDDRNERRMRVSQDVLTVLDRAHTEGNALHLPGQLERKLYVKTDAVLKAAGGKWNRKVRAHLSRMTRPPPSSRCWSAPSPYQVVGIYSP